jgi:hypothetical protein
MVSQILDMSRSLSSEIVRNGHHFVGSLNRLGVNLVASLRDDHIDHFFGEIDIRTLQESLLDRPESGGEAAGPLRRRAGGKAINKEITPHGDQPGRIVEPCELNLPYL